MAVLYEKGIASFRKLCSKASRTGREVDLEIKAAEKQMEMELLLLK